MAVPRPSSRTAHRQPQPDQSAQPARHSARPARNGALMALAADLPAAIIADLLGMHINTAIRWVRYAGRDWADYLAARAAEQDKKSGFDYL